MNNLIPIDQIERMAVAVAKSGLFGIKQPEQAIALMLIAQAEGMHPAIAARDYHLVQGRPALKADAMLARFQQAGGKVTWNTYTDQAVAATFTHPQGGSVTLEWTIAQAKAAGLTNKDVWKQYPRAMLRARVISEGIRTVFPGVVVGVYTPEEVEQFDAKPETKEVKSEPVTTVTPVPSPAVYSTPSADTAFKQASAKIKSSGWTSDQLKQYCEQAFKQSDSRKLRLEQLELLASIVSVAGFEQAMIELGDNEI
jgi:hypothetical protein